MSAKINIKNKRFGRLVAIKPTKKISKGSRSVVWRCLCDCGNITFVSSSNLGVGTRSCGCLHAELLSKLRKGNKIHGMIKSPEYYTWADMKQRCYNKRCKSYKYYGGRGIKVCKRWRESFVNFFEDMGKRPLPELTVERINNDKGYFPNNCKWATRKEQSNNRRNSIKRRAIKSEY